MRQAPFNPNIAIFIGVIFLSTTAVLVKLAGDVPAAIIANYRLLLAMLILLPIVFFKYRHEFSFLDKKDWSLSLLSGVFLAVFYVLWFESLNYTSIASSVVLIALQPIFTFIGMSFFIKDRFSQAAVISIFITLLGGAIIGWTDFQIGASNLFGVILALLSVVAITIYFLTGKTLRRKLSFITYTFIVYSIGSITLIAYNLTLQQSFFSYSIQQWWIFILLALLPTFFGQALFNWAMKWVSSATVSVGILFAPVSASVLAYFLIGEKISWSQWLGGSIVIFGLFLFIMGTRRKRSVTISERANN